MKKPFNPQMLPLSLENDIKLKTMQKLIDARLKIKEFDILLEKSPVGEIALNLFSLNESVQSTKIEGTQATFTDVIESKVTGAKSEDLQEVQNYIEALEIGQDLLKSIPISTRMFHKLHEVLLKKSRGSNRSPGEYRKIQNIDKLIGNLEHYINSEDCNTLDALLKAAIIHAQFETIHPYLDGNGRLGRVLIMLYLLETKVISKPSFFISEELEKNKFKYYTLLNNLRADNPNWLDWIDFFLDSAIKQADKYLGKLKAVDEYYSKAINFASDNNIHINYVNIMFEKIVFTSKEFEGKIDASYNTINKNINKLVQGKFLYADDKKRNKIYRAYDLLDILR
ncbi:Fic family protein [Cetobacterium sp.]|uniref:Fic family protein n=1 Tax=Cetobacterium sp. TaxID=2071632 RepID=UPI003EE75335